MILVNIINLVLVVTALLGFVLTIFGTPLGIIFIIIYFVKLKKKKSTKLLKLSLFLLSGLPILFVTFLIYALVNLIATFFGVDVLTSTTTNLLPIRIY